MNTSSSWPSSEVGTTLSFILQVWKLQHRESKGNCLKSHRKWQRRWKPRPSGAWVLVLTTVLHCLCSKVRVPHSLIWQEAGDGLRGEFNWHCISSRGNSGGLCLDLGCGGVPQPPLPLYWGQTCCNFSCSEVAISALQETDGERPSHALCFRSNAAPRQCLDTASHPASSLASGVVWKALDSSAGLGYAAAGSRQ